MTSVIDKLVLLLCSLFLSLSLSVSTGRTLVLLLLAVFMVLTLDELFDTLWFAYFSFFAGLIFSVFLPGLFFFFPAFLYPVYVKRRTPLVFFALLPMFTSSYLQKHPLCAALLSSLATLSVLLADREQTRKALTSDLIHLRDADKEEQLSLKQQTRFLEETQNANIKIATLQERTRIAREIHDNVGHLLSRSLLQVGAMLTVSKDDENLLLLKESLDDAMNGIRSSVHDLRDESLDLEVSVSELLKEFRGYKTDFEFDCSKGLPTSIVYCFLSIVKEALANITKHSNGDAIHINIKEYSAMYRLTIADNGIGASVPEVSSGMGLENMQTRVTALHGTVRFFVQDGFHIFVSVPKDPS